MAFPSQAITFNKLGGLRTDKALTDYEPFEAVTARNCRFNKGGSVQRRKGGAKYNTAQITGAGDVLGLYDFHYGASGQKWIECENTVIYTNDGTTRASIKTGMTAANYYSFSALDDFCWINNGVDTPLKYDGTTVTNASVVAPSVGTFSAAISAGAGIADGTYKHVITFYNTTTGQESNPFTLASASSATTLGPNNRITLSNIPVSTDTANVNARRVYRTTIGGSAYNAALVTTINDNTTTTYIDSMADASLGALVPLDHDVMPIFVKSTVHKGRGFGFTTASSRLYFSKLYNFWYWPQGIVDLSATKSLFYIDVDPDDGDMITNIITYYDYLLVFKSNAIYVLGGYDETDFFIKKIDFDDRVGCIGFRAADVAGNWCYFLDKNGVYRTNAQSVEYVGRPVEAFFDNNNATTTEKVNASAMDDSIVIADRKKPNSLIKIFIPTGSETKNSAVLVFDYVLEQWSNDNGFYAQSVAIRQASNIDYMMRGDNYGFVWTEESQEGDGGVIKSTATSGGASTLTDTAQSWTVDLYQGTFVEILSGPGVGERRLITSNTATALTITGAWTTQPTSTSVYTIGGIDYYYLSAWNNYGDPSVTKRLKWVRPRMETSGDYQATIMFWYDFQQEPSETSTIELASRTLWDVALWDDTGATWDSQAITQDYLRSPANKIHSWSTVGIRHKPAGQPIRWNGYDKIFQKKGLGT